MKKLLWVLPFFMAVLIFACSDDDNNPLLPEGTETTTWKEEGGGYWRSIVDATSEDDYVYFSFAALDTVSLTDEQAETDNNWDIAFKRSFIKLNGGISGGKDVVGVDLASVGSADSISFENVSDTSHVTSDDWLEDYYELVVDEWYSYNPVTHQLEVTNNVYIIKDAAERYVKFQVMEMAGGGMPPDMGSITCRFVYAADGNDVSGAPDTVTLDVGTGTAYLDFSSASEVSPANPEQSTDWDIAFTSYEIHLNSNIFGPGLATAYPLYLELEDPTDFDNVSDAPTQSQGYFWDESGSALTDWYNYTGPPNHQLLSKEHVYLLKSEGTVYKLQIYSYYMNVDGSPESAWYSFNWLDLE